MVYCQNLPIREDNHEIQIQVNTIRESRISVSAQNIFSAKDHSVEAAANIQYLRYVKYK